MPEAHEPRPSPAQQRPDLLLWTALLASPLAMGINAVIGYTVAHWVNDIASKRSAYLVSLVDFILAAGGLLLSFSLNRQSIARTCTALVSHRPRCASTIAAHRALELGAGHRPSTDDPAGGLRHRRNPPRWFRPPSLASHQLLCRMADSLLRAHLSPARTWRAALQRTHAATRDHDPDLRSPHRRCSSRRNLPVGLCSTSAGNPRRMGATHRARKPIRMLTSPLIAWLLEALALWTWHIPRYIRSSCTPTGFTRPST